MFVTYCDRIQNIAQASKMCMYNIILLPHPLNQKAVVECITRVINSALWELNDTVFAWRFVRIKFRILYKGNLGRKIMHNSGKTRIHLRVKKKTDHGCMCIICNLGNARHILVVHNIFKKILFLLPVKIISLIFSQISR